MTAQTVDIQDIENRLWDSANEYGARALFAHIFDSYWDDGRSVSSTAA